MTQVTGVTAARVLEIEAGSIVDGEVVGDNLILTKHDGTEINAGNVRGADGDVGSLEAINIIGAGGQPAFLNGWAGQAAAQPGFYLDRGVVRFRGQANAAGATGVQIFTLPVGYRPVIDSGFRIAARNAAGSAMATFNVLVFSTGEVQIMDDALAKPNAVYIRCYLDAISFRQAA